MDLDELQITIRTIEAQVPGILNDAGSIDALRSLESGILGKKGSLGSLISTIGQYPPAQRGEVGQTINAAKGRIKGLIERRFKEFKAADAAEEVDAAAAFDPTMPGDPSPMGAVHPVTAVQW